MRDLTDKPFGVNIAQAFVRDPDIVDFVVDQGVRFVTTSAGSPTRYTAALKDARAHGVPRRADAGRCAQGGRRRGRRPGGRGRRGRRLQEPDAGVDDGAAAAGRLEGRRADHRRRRVRRRRRPWRPPSRSAPRASRWAPAWCRRPSRRCTTTGSRPIVDAAETDTVFLNRHASPALRALRTERTTALEFDTEHNAMALFGEPWTSTSAATWRPASPCPARSPGASTPVRPVADIISEPPPTASRCCGPRRALPPASLAARALCVPTPRVGPTPTARRRPGSVRPIRCRDLFQVLIEESDPASLRDRTGATGPTAAVRMTHATPRSAARAGGRGAQATPVGSLPRDWGEGNARCWTTVCLAGLVLGAACSGSAGTATSSGGSGSSTAPSAQAPVTTTTTTPPPLSHEQAAERYLAIVEPYNIALEALEQALNGGQEVGALQAQAAAVATANATHIAGAPGDCLARRRAAGRGRAGRRVGNGPDLLAAGVTGADAGRRDRGHGVGGRARRRHCGRHDPQPSRPGRLRRGRLLLTAGDRRGVRRRRAGVRAPERARIGLSSIRRNSWAFRATTMVEAAHQDGVDGGGQGRARPRPGRSATRTVRCTPPGRVGGKLGVMPERLADRTWRRL